MLFDVALAKSWKIYSDERGIVMTAGIAWTSRLVKGKRPPGDSLSAF